MRRLALCRESIVGSHCKACTVHLLALSMATLRAHLHFRRLWSVVQSCMPRAVICDSASCVHRLIQSTHGSNSSSSFTVCECMSSLAGSLSTSPDVDSEVAPLVMVDVSGGLRHEFRRGEWCVVRESSESFGASDVVVVRFFCNPALTIQVEFAYSIVGVIVPRKSLSRPFNEYDFVGSSWFTKWNFPQAAAILLSCCQALCVAIR